jgi:CHAD domain-containing protein
MKLIRRGKMGQLSDAQKNEQMGSYIEAQAKAIATLYPQVRRRLRGEPVHSLRVATRRAQAALWVLKNSGEKLRFKKLSRELKALVDALGKVRSLDVAIADAKQFGIDFNKLASKQNVARRTLHGRLSRGRLSKIAKHFGKVSAVLRSGGLISTTLACDKLREQLAAPLRKPKYRPGDFHEVRIKMKKVRYVLEAMGKNVDSIRGLQKVLGNAHDLQILRGMTGEPTAMAQERARLNAEARRLIKPAIRVALTELRNQ